MQFWAMGSYFPQPPRTHRSAQATTNYEEACETFEREKNKGELAAAKKVHLNLKTSLREAFAFAVCAQCTAKADLRRHMTRQINLCEEQGVVDSMQPALYKRMLAAKKLR